MITIKDIFRIDAKEYFFGEKISDSDECTRQIENALLDNKCKNIIAPTGAGKNFAICNIAKRLGQRVILLVPYTMNVRQTVTEYGFDSPISIRDSIFNQEDPNSKYHIVSTYDSLGILMESGIDPSKYILVIDEYHNFVIQSSFRNRAILNVEKSLPYFKKIITITGTPEGVIFNNYESIKLSPVNQNEKTKVHIIKYKGELLDAVLAHIQISQHKGKIVIFRNDKTDLEYLNDVLRKCHRHSEILTSDEKDGIDYKAIANEQKIRSNVEILLTTSVISDGVNIHNEDIVAVYFLEVEDMTMYRQFYRRFRKGVSNVYDFIKDSNDKNLDWPDYKRNVRTKIEKFSQLCMQLPMFLRSVNFSISESSKVLSSDCIYVDKHTNEFRINKYRIISDELNLIFSLMKDDVNKRKEYLEAFENVIVNVSTFDLNKVGTEDIKNDLIIKTNNLKEQMIQVLQSFPNEVISFLANCGNFMEYKNLKVPKVDPSEVEKMLSLYREIIMKKDFNKLCDFYIKLKLRNVEHNLIIKILEQGKTPITKILKKLDIIIYLNKTLENSCDTSLTLIEVKLIDYWSKQFKNEDILTLEDLYNITYREILKHSYSIKEEEKLTKRTLWKLFNNLFQLQEVIIKDSDRKSKRGGYEILGPWSFESIMENLNFEVEPMNGNSGDQKNGTDAQIINRFAA